MLASGGAPPKVFGTRPYCPGCYITRSNIDVEILMNQCCNTFDMQGSSGQPMVGMAVMAAM